MQKGPRLHLATAQRSDTLHNSPPGCVVTYSSQIRQVHQEVGGIGGQFRQCAQHLQVAMPTFWNCVIDEAEELAVPSIPEKLPHVGLDFTAVATGAYYHNPGFAALQR